MSTKKLLSILFGLFISSSYSNGQPVARHGQLKVVGSHLTDQHDHTIVLRGMSFGWHQWWPRFYNEGAVKWLHEDWGCTVVRAAMGVEPNGGYIQKPEWSTATIQQVVDAAIKEGIYVIIDWHSHNINLKEARTFFTEMATRYGKYPNIIYEIFNEPDQESWQEVKAYATEIIAAIRSVDPGNIILVGTPHWDQDIHLAADDPIKGYSNIMYTFHFYAATHKQSLRERGDYAIMKGLPIFISESAGMQASGDGPLDEEEWNKWIDWAEQQKISWITWSITDKNETCSVLLPQAASEGGWKDTDLKISGLKAKALLKKYAEKQ